MLDEYRLKQVAGQMKLARYLITEADHRGLTHGEKHYLMQTALFLLHKAGSLLDDQQGFGLEPHEQPDIVASDIPF